MTLVYVVLYLLFLQRALHFACFIDDPLRMMKKIEDTLNVLNTCHSAIESKFNEGIVEGFNKKSFP